MKVSYRKLFSVRIRHPYYSDGQCRDVTMSPTRATSALMRKHGLLWKSYQSDHTMLTSASSHETGKLPLYFILNSTNPFFLNFTEHPLSRPLRKLYFHNLSASNSSDKLQTLGSSYWNSPDPPEFQGYQAPDYVVREISAGHLGLVDIHLNPTAEETDFLISLKPRNTIWRYWLVNRETGSVEDIAVHEKDNNAPLSFQTGNPRTLANGDPAVPLVLNDHHELSAPGQTCSERHTLRPVLQFTLRRDGNKSRKVVMNLPTPDYRQITTESTDSGLQLFSDMYVYFFKPNFF